MGTCVLERRSIHVPDLEQATSQFPRTRNMALKQGYRSAIYAPLLRAGEGLGTIAVFRRQPRAFGDKDVALLNTFADQAVIAIENVRLFNETQEALERQTATAEVLQVISGSMADARPVFERILDSCERLFGTRDLGVFLIDDQQRLCADACRGNFAEWAPKSYPRPVAGTLGQMAIDQGSTLYWEDTLASPWVPEYMKGIAREYGNFTGAVAPLMWEGRGIGTLNILRTPPRPMTDKELALQKTFADQAVIAIQNARLFNDTKEALASQTASAEILRVMSGSLTDVRPVFEAIVANAVKLLVCDSAFVMRRDGNTFSAVAAATPAGPLEGLPSGLPIDPAQNFPSRVIVDQRMLHLPDWSAIDLPDFERAVSEQFGIQAALYLPMLRDGECVGLLSLRQPAGGRFHRQGDRPGGVVPRPGADRHRERAAVQRHQGVAGAADRHGRGAPGDQRLDGRSAAGVRQDPGQLPSDLFACARPRASTWSGTTG